MKNFLKIVVGAVLTFLVMGVNSISAHSSPENCTGSGLGIALYADSTQVHVGETVLLSVDVFNGGVAGPIVCDVSNVEAFLVTPDGISHSITLTRTALSNADMNHYANVVGYVVRTQDIQGGILRVTARDTGIVHQNDTDSQGGGNQSINIGVLTLPPTVTPPVVTTTSSPPPTIRNPRRGSRRHPIVVPVVTPAPIVTPYIAPVPVIIPSLPSTGFPPMNENASRDSLFLFAALVVVSLPVIMVFKKSSI